MLGMRKVELALNGEEESNGPTAVVALHEGKIKGTGAEKLSKTKELQTSAYLYLIRSKESKKA